MLIALWTANGGLLVVVLILLRRLQSLKQSRVTCEEQYRTIFETVTDGLLINSLDGTVVEANPAVCRMHGYTREEFLGKSAAEFVHPESMDFFREYLAAVSAGQEFHCLAQGVRKDGSGFDVEVTGVPIRFQSTPHLLAIVRDVTERKKTLEALQFREEQGRRVVESARLATIGKMAAQIAHEIRNPLGAIKNAAFFVGRKLPKQEVLAHEHVELIQQEVSICVTIIENILSTTKIHPPRKSPLDLGPFVHEAFERLKRSDPAGDGSEEIAFFFDGDPDPFSVDADPVQFRQVIDNLLKNAAEAMNGKGEIRITARRTPAGKRIQVSDSGPGVPADEADRIFEVFETTKPLGTGLGLGISRQIIEHHGGTLALKAPDSTDLHPPCPGATFVIELPDEERQRLSENVN